LPGGIDDKLLFLGPYTSFILIILASTIPVALMFIYFKKLGWVNY